MSQANPIDVLVVTPQAILYRGQASSVTLPGEVGIFEVLSNHKPLLTLLISGHVMIDNKGIPIRRGIVKVVQNKVFAIVEESSN
ncbi:MAG: hypothetical protein HY587_01615 [Candidatus Omnitrophica bacterium]|nr:hypothetical protein [Candidatus Omnitrophota bacterium]